MKAFKKKEMLSYGDGEILIEADFSRNKNNFICAIYGHTHYDQSYVDEGVLSFSTTCDKVDSRFGYSREYGTIKEHAFDVVTVDFEKKKIYLTRIGAGEDREFSY